MALSNVYVDDVYVGEDKAYVDVTFRLDQPTTETATVDYYTLSGSAGIFDYVGQDSFVTFAPGETVQTVRIYLESDFAIEGAEVFYIKLDASTANVLRPDTSAEIWIVDNDAPAGTPDISVSSVVVDEKQGTASFIVTLDRPSTGDVTVSYTTQDGSALAGEDYVATSGSLLFAAGEVVKTVTVDLIDDTDSEANESFLLQLTNLSGASSTVPSGTATIWANDAPAVAQSIAHVDDVYVSEDSAFAEVTIYLDQPNLTAATVDFVTSSGSAGLFDYDGRDGSVTFAAGETVKTVRIVLNPDDVIEGDEVFYFTLDASSANVSRPDPTAEIWLVEDGGHSGTEQADMLAGTAFADVMFGYGGDDTILGLAGNDELYGGDGLDMLTGGSGDDLIDGGSNVDTATVSGNHADYTVIQTSTGVFEVSGPDGTDTLENVEFLQFADELLRLLPGDGVAVDFSADPATYMAGIRDFDGNDLGGLDGWLRIGEADVNGDGDLDQLLVNMDIGRWAEVGVQDDGLVYFDDHGWAGETRVVGIYIDPLVQSGEVEAGSDFDSQQRFQNDLFIGNITEVLGADDYDADGFQEVYFALTDGTAYLHAYMHVDGNIQYANYQSEQQVIDYLSSNGYGEETYGSWFTSGTQGAAAIAAEPVASDTLSGSMIFDGGYQDGSLILDSHGGGLDLIA